MRILADYEVVCVDTDDSSQYDDCRCITRIGLDDGGWSTEYVTPGEAYDLVERRNKTIVVDGTTVEGNIRNGTKYVRSQPNDSKDDNLLQQDGC